LNDAYVTQRRVGDQLREILVLVWKTSTEDTMDESQTFRIDNTSPTMTTAIVNNSTVGKFATELTIEIAVCSCSPSNRERMVDAMLMKTMMPTAPTIPVINTPKMAPALTTRIHHSLVGKVGIRTLGASRREGSGLIHTLEPASRLLG